ncbi:MAG: hypothetical protein KY393_05145 [Actinobacteria bacterium]|nr:hypothetical protein [Actinomycetota bacterium]
MERLIAGKPPTADSGLDDVARVVDSVRTAYMSEADPKLEAEHLHGLMNLVHLTDKGDLAVRSASKVNGPGFQVSGLPTRRRRFVLETLFASLAAKVAIGGVAVAMASTGAVAATGNLPDRMQTTVSQAVDNIGINIPLGETAASEQEALDKELDTDDAEQDAGDSKDAAEPDQNAGFGGNVSEDAQEGGINGRETGDRAREMGEERRETGQSQPPAGVPMGDGYEGAERSGAGGQIDDTPAAEQAPGDIPAGPDPFGGQPDGIPGGRP